MKRTAWSSVVESLAAEGVEYVFGLPGDPRHLLPELHQHPDIEFVLVRHEASAIAAAYAYSRISGKVGVCFTSPGPGTTNIVSGLLESFSGCQPIIALSIGVETINQGKGAFQELDAVNLMRPVVKSAFHVPDPKKIPWIMKRAFSLAMNGKPGPVFIEMPSDIGLSATDIEPYRPALKKHRMRPDDASVIAAAGLIAAAKRPLMICGSGAVSSGAHRQVQDFCEMAGLPVFTTPGGRGIVSESHDLSCGQIGIYFTEFGKQYYDASDLVISVGSQLEAFSTGWWKFFPANAKFIQLDIDPNTIAMNWHPDIALVGDAALSLQDLSEKVLPIIEKNNIQNRVGALIARKKIFIDRIAQESRQQTTPIRPARVVSEINHVFGSDTILVNENGATDLWSYYWPYYKVLDAGDCVPMAEQTCMGFGVAGTIGAKLARPDKKVVCVVGDGAMQMCLMEMATAAENKCGITWVVLNNNCLGWPQYHQLLLGQALIGTDFKIDTDFVKIAESMGCKGVRAENPEQVRPAFEFALAENANGVPVLLDIRIEKHDYPPHFQQIHKEKHNIVE